MALNKFSLWLFAHCNVTGNALILGLKFIAEHAEATAAELFEAVEADKAAIGELAELADDSEEALHCPPVDGV